MPNARHRYTRGRDQNKYKFTVDEGTSEKGRHMFRSHKIRSPFHIESYLSKYLKQVATESTVDSEDNNNILHEVVCRNCEAVYSVESKRSIQSGSDEHKICARNCNCENKEIVKHCWEADHKIQIYKICNIFEILLTNLWYLSISHT